MIDTLDVIVTISCDACGSQHQVSLTVTDVATSMNPMGYILEAAREEVRGEGWEFDSNDSRDLCPTCNQTDDSNENAAATLYGEGQLWTGTDEDWMPDADGQIEEESEGNGEGDSDLDDLFDDDIFGEDDTAERDEADDFTETEY